MCAVNSVNYNSSSFRDDFAGFACRSPIVLPDSYMAGVFIIVDFLRHNADFINEPVGANAGRLFNSYAVREPAAERKENSGNKNKCNYLPGFSYA